MTNLASMSEGLSSQTEKTPEPAPAQPGRIYRGRAHGKVILIGEHSVVHFKPAIALPLMTTAIDVAVSANGSSYLDPRFHLTCDYYSGPLESAPFNLNNLKKLQAALHNRLCLPQKLGGFDINIVSTIPRERGMGSSAAVAVALTRAIAAYSGVILSEQEIFDYSQISENVAHGNASGLDSIATAHDKAVWFERGAQTRTFDLACPGVLIVADTGIRGGTREAVEDVHKLLYSQERGEARQAAKDIDRLGELTADCARALRQGDVRRLGYIMDEAHEALSSLAVSSPELDRLVAAARRAGAAGAKLTGGGRGGCMIALVADPAVVSESSSADGLAPGESWEDRVKRVKEALLAAGAVHTWRLPLNSQVTVEEEILA